MVQSSLVSLVLVRSIFLRHKRCSLLWEVVLSALQKGCPGVCDCQFYPDRRLRQNFSMGLRDRF